MLVALLSVYTCDNVYAQAELMKQEAVTIHSANTTYRFLNKSRAIKHSQGHPHEGHIEDASNAESFFAVWMVLSPEKAFARPSCQG